MMQDDCPLCVAAGGELVWHDASARVVLADEPGFPGFTRVIWRSHVTELTDLPADDRARVMALVCCVEAVQRAVLQPHKVNLASLGNLVAHLHWHVIPRWRDDSHFPAAIWSAAVRDGTVRGAQVSAALPAYREALVARLRGLAGAPA